ncbi:cysteine desulfurase [Alkalihalobacillus sp. MEB130]|uniref:cysteine desulfurase family protein n=1 Tax=Alkalihalobacillus sp. MEB130 TaxID=2976704 RepID=UPI0028DFE55C|nr:cysteine desulfurase family protein [Alkalihalobacillus sp. MEB130]MDT8859380.1 cysteine desulfurase [Alkalihalobacillus sp. MEB130]
MIYLDNSATTKPYKEVIETFSTVASTYFGNPSSLHSLGMQAEGLIGESRNRIAHLLGIKANEIIFTSGGTEGNNIAIKGAAKAKQSRGKHLITTQVEHASVHEAFSQLEKEGFDVTYVPVDENGMISVERIKNEIRSDTILVSMIHVNNETGAILPVQKIGELLKAYPQILFHVDHVQGVSKVPLDLKDSGIDLCTFSAHKFHGMKGNGFLFVREGLRIDALFHGGEQEGRLRAGTENVAGIVAMAKALRLATESASKSWQLEKLRQYLVNELTTLEGVVVNSPDDNVAPHIVNFSIPGVKPEVVVQSLTAKEIYVSTKSACSSKVSEPSRVLLAMGLSEERANSGIRVSFSYETTQTEIDQFISQLKIIIPELLEVVNS